MRQKRNISKEFIDYQEFIVSHPNYKTLPNKFNSDGEITWVKVGDVSRANWWDNLVREMKLEDRASVARAIHPKELNGFKPCQVCGFSMDVNYSYLRPATLRKLLTSPKVSEVTEVCSILTNMKNPTIENVLQTLEIEKPELVIEFANILNIKLGTNSHDSLIKLKYQKNTHLSPGVMSNAPDRLDGFHTYNMCCRPTEDTGRSKSNLARYTQDRRAYENWSDGDWKLANRIMGVYANSLEKVPCPQCGIVNKMTADHIGPVSLGFSHSGNFKPLCISCNSSKNNRFTFKDFEKLIELEENGTQVVSWHSQYIWNLVKKDIKNDSDCLIAAIKLRKNLHQVLLMLSIVLESGHRDFLLRFLHPEFSHFEHEITNFDPNTGAYSLKSTINITENTKSNADRYIRISFESLTEYAIVENRRIFKWNNKTIDALILNLQNEIKAGNEVAADKALNLILKAIADINYKN